MRDIQLSKLNKSDTFGGFKGGFVVFLKLQFWLDLEIKIILNYKLWNYYQIAIALLESYLFKNSWHNYKETNIRNKN